SVMVETMEPGSPADAASYGARKTPRSSRAPAAVEVRIRAERRRSWTPEDKLGIVRETPEPGAVSKAVAERHGISTGLLFTWRKQMLATAMSGFAPVEMASEPPRLEPPSPAAVLAAPEAPGMLEIGFPSGATVRVSGRVDPGMLRVVLAGLGGR
ncbi:IS66-like element accessory protein TnpA, partial [Craurococcus roseus]|uniref:IS66-like element accessory protein TnpA n=1 Tax=Craurococcus roseus TaxID=77585 RepID=UPI0031E3108F